MIVSSSTLSVIDVKIPSHPSLNSINFYCEYNSSLRFNFESKIFDAFSSHSLNNFRVIKIFFTKTKYLIALNISINFYNKVIFAIFV